MIEKKLLLKRMVSSILRQEQGLPDHHIMHPFREWLTSLLITTIILSFAVFFCIRLYWHYSDISPALGTANQDKSNTIYRTSEVNEALKNFSERTETYEAIKSKLLTSTPIQAEESVEEVATSSPITETVATESAITIPPPVEDPAPVEEDLPILQAL